MQYGRGTHVQVGASMGERSVESVRARIRNNK